MEPRPDASTHATFKDAHSGQNGRGNQITAWQSSHFGSNNRPSAVASQYVLISGSTTGAGAGSTWVETVMRLQASSVPRINVALAIRVPSEPPVPCTSAS